MVPRSANHISPSAASVSPNGELPAFSPAVNSVIAPLVVTRPMAPPGTRSVNHRFPSGPAASVPGAWPAGSVNSVIVPVVVIRPIAGGVARSVNQRLPSGLAAMTLARARRAG